MEGYLSVLFDADSHTIDWVDVSLNPLDESNLIGEGGGGKVFSGAVQVSALRPCDVELLEDLGDGTVRVALKQIVVNNDAGAKAFLDEFKPMMYLSSRSPLVRH